RPRPHGRGGAWQGPARRVPLPGPGTVLATHARRGDTRNWPDAPDPRAHGLARPPGRRGRPLRRPRPAGAAGAARGSRLARRGARLRAPGYPKTPAIRVATTPADRAAGVSLAQQRLVGVDSQCPRRAQTRGPGA